MRDDFSHKIRFFFTYRQGNNSEFLKLIRKKPSISRARCFEWISLRLARLADIEIGINVLIGTGLARNRYGPFSSMRVFEFAFVSFPVGTEVLRRSFYKSFSFLLEIFVWNKSESNPDKISGVTMICGNRNRVRLKP